MAFKYTEEQLNKLDKELLIQLFLGLQEQLEALTAQTEALNTKMQQMMEQLILSNKNRFGRSSEKMEDANQICFMEVDGTIVFFNEAEAVCDLSAPEPDDLEQKTVRKKQSGKREADISGLPRQRIDHYLVSAKYSCGFSNTLISSIIVGERYLDYFTTITEDRLWQPLAKPVFRWRNSSGLSMNAAKAV